MFHYTLYKKDIMYKCTKCDKDFKYKSKLAEHSNKKIKCDITKNINLECKVCDLKFRCNAENIRHEKTKGHIKKIKEITINGSNNTINNINGDHNTINNIQHILHLTLKTNAFTETDISIISNMRLASIFGGEEIERCIKNIKDNKSFTIHTNLKIIFDAIIHILKFLNFNVAFVKNNNCQMIFFTHTEENFVKYYLLEINHEKRQYFHKVVDYDIFIEELLKIMDRINDKHSVEFFDIMLKYIRSNIAELTNKNIKKYIEDKIIKMYTDFQLTYSNKNENMMKKAMDETQKIIDSGIEIVGDTGFN